MIEVDFKIVLKDEVYDEIFTLMRNIKSLNNGKEIAGWLFGDWVEEDKQLKLFLDEFIIPEQKVSSAEVDIDPESMVDTIKEVGAEKCNRIKAHWHIHPFGKGSTNWSTTDEEKITDFMEPTKKRDIFVFLLSSEDQIKARVEVNFRGGIAGFEKQIVLTKTYDNLDVEKETKCDESPYYEKLKSRIKEKVEEEKYVNYYKDAKNWKDTTGVTIENVVEDVSFYSIKKKKKRIKIKLTEEFAQFIEGVDYSSEDLIGRDEETLHNDGYVTWTYILMQTSSVKKVASMLDEELTMLQDEFNKLLYQMEEEEDEFEQGRGTFYQNSNYLSGYGN